MARIDTSHKMIEPIIGQLHDELSFLFIGNP